MRLGDWLGDSSPARQGRRAAGARRLNAALSVGVLLTLVLTACAAPVALTVLMVPDGAQPAKAAPAPATAPAAPAAMHRHTMGEVPASFGAAPPRDGISPLLGNLGQHKHKITTSSELAQQYFDEGFNLTYGFNHEEAIRSYRDAISLDPNCAMCYWGIAYALGPNINAPMGDDAVPAAWAALQQARALAPKVSLAEQGYIEALTTRYVAMPVKDRTALDVGYADAMRLLVKRYPDDLDAATLFAEALMDLSPWNFFTNDGQPTKYTAEIVGTLESVLARNPLHPGANHYYIHAVEASTTPDRAIPSAERLETLVPGAGHLVHMPAHAYWRVGRYADAERVNGWAINVDEASALKTKPDQGTHTFYMLAYYPHNIHFLFSAAQMEGRSEFAIQAARKLVASIPAEAYVAVPEIEDFRPMAIYALARFGRWDDLMAEPAPDARLRFATAMWHWARGLANARQGRLDAAQTDLDALYTIAQSPDMADRGLASGAKATTIMGIATHVLTGELAGARGQSDTMLAELRAAVQMQDNLNYIEPPAWYYPTRHNLGAALLALGRAAEAEAVYRTDLVQYRQNGWGLFGLAESLRTQGKTDEAAQVQAQFNTAWSRADVTLTASRY